MGHRLVVSMDNESWWWVHCECGHWTEGPYLSQDDAWDDWSWHVSMSERPSPAPSEAT